MPSPSLRACVAELRGCQISDMKGTLASMGQKKKKRQPVKGVGTGPEAPRILVGDWWPRGNPDALSIAYLAFGAGDIRDMRRAMFAWGIGAILESDFPAETSGFEVARFLHSAFRRELWCRHAGEEDDMKWMRQVFKEAVDAAGHDSREYLLLGAFEHMFEDLEIREFFKGWAHRGPVAAKFYDEACFLADGFIEIAEAERKRAKGRAGA